MATIQSFNNETLPLLDIGRRNNGIATRVDVHWMPHIIIIIVFFTCGIISIVFGGIGLAIKWSSANTVVFIELNSWIGIIVS